MGKWIVSHRFIDKKQSIIIIFSIPHNKINSIKFRIFARCDFQARSLQIMSKSTEYIEVYGAREHNLKNINVKIPRNELVVITGLSGSGKSSLAFDTIFAEGQRRYIETFSAYARQFLGGLERPDVDKIEGLSPVIAIEQKTTNKNPRSTVGTVTELYDFLRLLYARVSDAYSLSTGQKLVSYTEDQILDTIKEN